MNEPRPAHLPKGIPMLESIRTLTGRPIEATDGSIGNTHDFLFDDHKWVIRYVVADTANWLPGRKVLISPYLVQRQANRDRPARFPVKLTRNEIREAPGLDQDMPVSTRYEQELARFYSYPMYVGAGPDLWGYSPYPILSETSEAHEQEMQAIGRSHLRSVSEVLHYQVQATDGDIGRVADFIVEERSWAIRYVVVDTTTWWPGGKVLISPAWVHEVNWSERQFAVVMNRKAIKQSPPYSPDTLLSRDYEKKLHEHFQMPPYW